MKRCLRARSASDLLPCLHGTLMLQLSLSGCSASRCCCSQKLAACSPCAAKRYPVPCHASAPEAAVRVQGACGTCPSSAGTMKMGIERALQASRC